MPNGGSEFDDCNAYAAGTENSKNDAELEFGLVGLFRLCRPPLVISVAGAAKLTSTRLVSDDERP